MMTASCRSTAACSSHVLQALLCLLHHGLQLPCCLVQFHQHLRGRLQPLQARALLLLLLLCCCQHALLLLQLPPGPAPPAAAAAVGGGVNVAVSIIVTAAAARAAQAGPAAAHTAVSTRQQRLLQLQHRMSSAAGDGGCRGSSCIGRFRGRLQPPAQLVRVLALPPQRFQHRFQQLGSALGNGRRAAPAARCCRRLFLLYSQVGRQLLGRLLQALQALIAVLQHGTLCCSSSGCL
jgi:hypothetical protein